MQRSSASWAFVVNRSSIEVLPPTGPLQAEDGLPIAFLAPQPRRLLPQVLFHLIDGQDGSPALRANCMLETHALLSLFRGRANRGETR